MTEVSNDTARAMGFAVDHDLALLGRMSMASFHRGDFACGSVASLDAMASLAAQVQALLVVHQAPPVQALSTITCPPDYLLYRSTVHLQADDGSIAGTFGVDFTPYLSGLYGTSAVDIRRLAGSLGVRVDAARPHSGVANVRVMLDDAGMSGLLFFLVSYANGQQDQGDGGFWPADASEPGCGWLSVPEVSTSPMISLDAYNQSCAAAGEAAPTF